jgi:adenylate kinase family enzyme
MDDLSPELQLLGKKIHIRGTAGKTTLATSLSRKTGIPYVGLDAIRHQPGWVEMPDDEFCKVVTEKLDGMDSWIADGNYTAVLGPEVVRRADTVILVHLRWREMFWRLLKRTVRRSLRREELWNGNRESWRMSFFSRQSLLWYHVKTRKRHGQRLARTREWLLPETRLVELMTASELDDFYSRNGLAREYVKG